MYHVYDRSGVDSDDEEADTQLAVAAGPTQSAAKQAGPTRTSLEAADEGQALLGTAGPVDSDDAADDPRCTPLVAKAAALVGALVLVNVLLFVVLGLFVTAGYNGLLSPSLLAFSFGLRHAVDADHIAAIDNVTRKLIQEGTRPLTVGLWFSLGHSSVVVILCAAIAGGSTYARSSIGSSNNVGNIIGTAVSATVLLLIGTFNMVIAHRLARRWAEMRASSGLPSQSSQRQENGRGEHSHDGVTWHSHLIEVTPAAEVGGMGGFLTRCCPRIFRAVDAPWKMYPIGFLFGLGFDTASEVGLLALAASAPSNKGGDPVPG